jgi:ATP-dependent Lon protease
MTDKKDITNNNKEDILKEEITQNNKNDSLIEDAELEIVDAESYEQAFLLPVHDAVIFPFTLTSLIIDSKELIDTLEMSMQKDRTVCIFPAIPDNENSIQYSDMNLPKLESENFMGQKISKIGSLCRVVKKLRFPDDTIRILVRGVKRIEALQFPDELNHQVQYTQVQTETEPQNIEIMALVQNILSLFQEMVSLSQAFPEELKIAILSMKEDLRLADLIADTLNISHIERIKLLATIDMNARLRFLTFLMNREINILKIGSDIQSQVAQNLGKGQKEIFLREQLKVIRQELGEDKNPEIIEIQKRINELDIPENALEIINKELERLEMIPQAASEYNVIYTYIDWLISVPWNNYSEDYVNIEHSKKILDKDHYDLTIIKERILEFLAVLQLKKDRKAPILCFVGPPGVGKTSLGQSIAKSMNRKFVRMSLGGIRDEAEIRGHRRTYVGALPGRIIQGLKKVKTANPVFMLDEIDKIGNDFRGDPASALLEVLDPRQNFAFNDHYLELDFDLSSVMFIATANITDTIPGPLLDRMEIIHLPGYTVREKQQIAKKFLIPRQIKENGLTNKQIFFPAATVNDIITLYTREAGVRKLERTFGAVCRKIARKIIEKKIDNDERSIIKSKDLSTYLGPRKFFQDEAAFEPEIGSAVGMAWTSVGGVILNVEVNSTPGKGALELTGSLGDVMKESAKICFTYVKSKAKELNIDFKVFEENDFHIHVPDGATPKDGPSAGITIATALISYLSKKPVKPALSMTGEITLRGKITPVGGVKEKVIAAMAAGIKTVILPEKNEKDLQDIPDDVKKKLNFKFVSNLDQALKISLMPKSK